MCDVALPIDVETVRKYDLVAKDFKLPPLQIDGNTGLLPIFIKNLGEIYRAFCAEEKKDFLSKHPHGTFQERTDFEIMLQPLLADIMCYCCKFWYLHPWLSRQEAYVEGITHFEKNFKKRGDCKKLIDPILLKRKDVLLTQHVLALKTIQKEGDPEHREVFEDNESAHLFLFKFLNHNGHEISKESLDVLEDMHDYIKGLSREEQTKYAKFMNIVPKETAAYLEKKAKAKEKEDKMNKKKREHEAMEAIIAEKKQKFLEKIAKQAQQNAKKAKEAAIAEEAKKTTEGGSKKGGSKEDANDAILKMSIDFTDKYAEFWVRISNHSIVEQRGFLGKRNQFIITSSDKY
jgi:hypothetical protein